MKPARMVLAALVAAGAVPSAQTTPIPTSSDVAFEVASVKLNKSGERNSSTSGRAGGFTATNVTGQQLIIFAYRLRQFQLASGPSWLGSERFDILARVPEGAKPDNPAMTRALLRDRFKLVVHTDTKQEQVYALVVDRADGRLGHSSSRPLGTARRRRREHRIRAASTRRSTTPGEVWWEPASRWSSSSARLAASG
jgi:uncharacterized protein (TIGR03435 family)